MRSSGSSRRPAVSSSREAGIAGANFDSSRARTTDANPGTVGKISSTAQKNSPVLSSDQKHSTSSSNFENRRKALEDWMGKLLSDIDVSRTVHVALFLELEAAARSAFYAANQIDVSDSEI
ncbi:uncharacterized protein LOC141712052 isoform X2 [Apium graveolens]|uniref:uncharacterized protein LOC141712052 isoform X2 n=1 Tax=Apium graveolens TaxID=4045 RepID=UPI003D7B2CFC